jgi:hypothetical protein
MLGRRSSTPDLPLPEIWSSGGGDGGDSSSTKQVSRPTAAASPSQQYGCCGQCVSGRTRHWKNGTGGWRPAMNNCDFDMSGNFLRHIYGEHVIKPRAPWPSGVQESNLLMFNQSRYLSENWTAGLFASGMDSTGFAYVPTACRASLAGCRYHVHYHPW